MKFLVLHLLLSIPLSIFSQSYLKQNEKPVLEFKTAEGKNVTIAMDKNEKYLVYRYGSIDYIEFEYPKNGLNCWNKFKFSSFARGGGAQNKGVDLNYLYFDSNPYRYVVFQEYRSTNECTEYGIKIINRATQEIETFKADSSTVKGTLNGLRELKQLLKSDELF